MIKTVIEMKKIIYLMMIVFAAGYVFSCKEMDSTYKEFLVPNGLTYPQKPDSLKVYTGYNKLRLTWLKAKDPSVVRAMIYWNNYTDSLEVNLRDNSDDIISVDIPVPDENTYTFQVKTFDVDGNASIPSEVSGAAVGKEFRAQFKNRDIVSAIFSYGNGLTITWGDVPDYSDSCILTYTNIAGKTVTFSVSSSDAVTVIADWKDWKEQLIYFTHFVYVEALFAVDAINQIVSIPMYLTGTAIPGENPITLTATNGRQYVWTGNLNAGGFKFLFNPASDLPSLNKDSDNKTLVERTIASEPDNMFQVTRAGYYTITIDIEKLTIVILYKCDKTEWTVEVSDDQADDGGGKDVIIDGDLSFNRWWHSQYSPALMPCPHWAVIDMKEPVEVSRILTVRRNNGDTKTIQYFVGDSHDVNADTWVKVAEGAYPSKESPEHTLILDVAVPVTGRYLKLVMPDSFRDPLIGLCEIEVYEIK
jgi:hypothetical protein